MRPFIGTLRVRSPSSGLGVDGVVDAAGISATLKTALDLVRPAGWITKVGWGRDPLDFLLIRSALKELVKSEGAVLNIGSINGYCGEPMLLAYSMSKGALMTLSRNLANVLGPKKVRVNHFNVGWVLTPNEFQLKIADGLREDWPENVAPETAVCGRLIKPEEIAAAAVYWLSDESRPISGSVVELEQYPVIGRISTSWDEE